MQPELVIRHRRVEADAWCVLGLAEGEPAHPLPGGPVLLPLAEWIQVLGSLAARPGPTAPWLAPGDDPVPLAQHLAALPMVAVHFPKSGDGRGYSIATWLRRNGFAGELRAFGDVARDQLHDLARVGFDSFRLAEGRDPHAALASLDDFSLHYQGDSRDPVPLFRRRPAARPEDVRG